MEEMHLGQSTQLRQAEGVDSSVCDVGTQNDNIIYLLRLNFGKVDTLYRMVCLDLTSDANSVFGCSPPI